MTEILLGILLLFVIVMFYKYNNIKKQYEEIKKFEINDSDIHRENFIKFLSDSRDMAFEYIDQAQLQIKEFTDIADKEFAFFDSYGMLAEGQLFYDTMNIMSREYKKLKSLLPEDEATRNN